MEDILSIEEPDLSVVILIEIAVHLQYLDWMDFLYVIAYFQDLAKAVVAWSHSLQSIFNLRVNLRDWNLLDIVLVFCNDLVSIFTPDCIVVIFECKTFSFKEFGVIGLYGLLKNKLVIVIDLHGEIDGYMFSQASSGFYTSLNALKSSPLTRGSLFFHHIDELCLVDNLYDWPYVFLVSRWIVLPELGWCLRLLGFF